MCILTCNVFVRIISFVCVTLCVQEYQTNIQFLMQDPTRYSKSINKFLTDVVGNVKNILVKDTAHLVVAELPTTLVMLAKNVTKIMFKNFFRRSHSV